MVLVSAVMAEANRRLRLKSNTLNFWRTLWASFIFLPCLFLFEWPQNSLFYISAFLTGVVSALTAVAMFYLSAQHNGRVASLSAPLVALATFVFWLPFDDVYRESFFDDSFKAVSVCLCLCIGAASMWFMRKCSASREALKILLVIAAPNPAYAKALMMTVSVFMLFYHRLFGIEDRASVGAGTVMALSMIGLVLLTS